MPTESAFISAFDWHPVLLEFTVKLCRSSLDHADVLAAVLTPKPQKDLKRALHDVFRMVINGNLKPEQAVSALKEIREIHREVLSVAIDVLTILDIETLALEEPQARERYLTLLKLCMGVLPSETVTVRMNEDTLDGVGVLNKKNFKQKFVRTKTKLFYKQQKFNLLREESEGYAKLIVELGQEFKPTDTPDKLSEHVKSLIDADSVAMAIADTAIIAMAIADTASVAMVIADAASVAMVIADADSVAMVIADAASVVMVIADADSVVMVIADAARVVMVTADAPRVAMVL
ncbi:PREDICTED: THO complex subunit 2-like [Priapulus caudatus]|uniref:THO complex subunit 2-like n=1 Tax=Priapulus caudatus TaxID=37621 RepID=A0ABM1F3N5_PRICU|nr:PREDICTED: THO complex subunit 2-like [Priapulus caudatus]